MLKFAGKFGTTLFLVAMSTIYAVGQESASDSLIYSWKLRELRFGTDLIGLGKTAFDPKKTEFELNFEANIKRFILNVEFGHLTNTRNNDSTIEYHTSGNYARLGFDFNTVKKDIGGSAIFIGVRYAQSFYKDNILYKDNSNQPYWDVIEDTKSNSNLSASWFELVGGIKVRIWKDLWMGYTARVKFGLNHDKGSFKSYEIPGYGRNTKNTYYGFNYQIYYNIPFY